MAEGTSMQKKRIIVGVSGASGMPVAIALLETLRAFPNWETRLILSRGSGCRGACRSNTGAGRTD